MQANDIQFVNFFIPILLLAGGVYASYECYKRGYQKGVNDSLKDCKHGGIHDWGKWKFFDTWEDELKEGDDWDDYAYKRRWCKDCNDFDTSS